MRTALNPACEKRRGDRTAIYQHIWCAWRGFKLYFFAACSYVMCFALLRDNTLHASVNDDTIKYLNIFGAHSVMHIFTELGNVCD